MPKKKEENVRNIDIIAAIPAFNEHDSISFVVKQIDKTLNKYFSKQKALIICCDGGSTDTTKDVFLNTKTKTEKLFLQTAPGTTGKGSVFKMLFSYVVKTSAKAVIVNDADLKSINPEWVKLQLDSILKLGYDYATPYYSRYKYDGTITNNICYPLIRALFGQDIRQPIGGDFAFSKRLSDYWIKEAFWPVNAPLFGIDIFMTTNAIVGNFKICQVSLGAKIHRAKDPALTLDPMFRQVVSTLFKQIVRNKSMIKKVKKIKKIPILGPKMKKEPKAFDVNQERLEGKLIDGFKQHCKTMKRCLSKENYNKIKSMAHTGRIHITSELWARIVYDYIIVFKKHEKQSSTILKSLVPLWFGRTATFIGHTINDSHWEAEEDIREQADIFYELKNYLISKL